MINVDLAEAGTGIPGLVLVILLCHQRPMVIVPEILPSYYVVDVERLDTIVPALVSQGRSVWIEDLCTP